MRERNTMNDVAHIPVLLHEVLEGLAVRPEGWYVDCTIGLGGHSRAILEASSPGGRLLGLDADPETLERARLHLSPFGDRVRLVHSNFRNLQQIAHENDLLAANGILMDLGLSSWQLADAERGFSFQQAGAADMRFDREEGPSVADLLNTLDETELADIIWRYGEEPGARRIARAIMAARPIFTADKLAGVVAGALGRRGKIHPATRTFQALRIAVNHELEALQEALPQAVQLLAPEGRLAVIAFHSLEDRIVKTFFRDESRNCICPPELPGCVCNHQATVRLVAKKPITPGARELADNPRARSAKLRIVERIGQTT
jgi:16S rRNA (cytosine1402-N4)-methyltransferase